MDSAAKLLRKSAIAARCLTDEDAIRAAWKAAVGKIIASHTEAAAVADGTLIVDVEDEDWLYQLNMLRGQILVALHKKLESAKPANVKFRLRRPARIGPARESNPVRGPEDEADKIQDWVLGRIYKTKRKRSLG
jgi:predicted nucleic acid-binding Zn ribbon protein